MKIINGLKLVNQSIKTMKKIKLLTLLLFLYSAVSFAQQRAVSGTVVDDTNVPIPGANVIVVGTKTGTLTDIDGKFSLKLTNTNQTLEFSSVGFTTQKVDLKGKETIKVKLLTGSVGLQEVVVVGYGTQKKINLTGAVETVKFDGAVNAPVTNAGQLLYGEFTGIQLTQGSGLAGNDASAIVIRGIGTFGNTNPLVVIDNIQYNGLTEFNNLAPSDIASISLLKDASAGAIYGSRAANGVIIVTTKRGKAGTSTIDYSTYTGFQDVTVIPKYFNAYDYARLRVEYDTNQSTGSLPIIRYTDANIQAIVDGSDPDRYANTNWADEILKSAPITNHYLSFSGGSEKTKYRLSLGYITQGAVVQGKFKNERYNFGLNINSEVKSWLTVTNVLNTYWEVFQGPSGGAGAIGGETGIINQFQRSAPTIPAYYSNGEYGIVDGSWRNSANPSVRADNGIRRGFLGDNQRDDISISDRLGLNFKIAKGLTFETSGSVILDFTNSSNYNPRWTIRDYEGVEVLASVVNSLSNTSSFNYSFLVENILRYEKSFNSVHNISFLGGHSAKYDRNDSFSGSLENFPTDVLQEFDAGGISNPNVSGGASETSLQSVYGRVNYNFKERYLFEANVRLDGSSRVNQARRLTGLGPSLYSTYPSLSAGWVASKESFLKDVSWLSNLKFRGSWGVTGNDGQTNYVYDQTYSVFQNDYILGTTPAVVGGASLNRLANQNIAWEAIEQLDVAVDLGLFKNKISLTAEYYKKNSTDVLYTEFPVPSSIGVSNIAAVNAASILNKGLEFSFSYREQIGDLKFSFGASVTRNLGNTVTGLGQDGRALISGVSIITLGHPFLSYFGYKNIGIFQTTAEVAAAPVQFGSTRTGPGDLIYEDFNGDNKIDSSDRQIIGNPNPDWLYNFNAKMSYKFVDFSILFQGVEGIDRYLDNNGQRGFPDARNNALSYWINRWTPDNPSTTLPRLGGFNNGVTSDFYIEDASYLRIKNIELGFSVPEESLSKYGLQRLRLYVGAQNLFTFTNLKNFDPERASGSGSALNVPLYKIYSLGLNLKF